MYENHVTCLFWVCSSWKHIQSELCILVRGHGDMARLRPMLTKTLPVLCNTTLCPPKYQLKCRVFWCSESQGSQRGPCLLGSTAAWVLNSTCNCKHYTFSISWLFDSFDSCHVLIHYSWLWTLCAAPRSAKAFIQCWPRVPKVEPIRVHLRRICKAWLGTRRHKRSLWNGEIEERIEL